MATVYVASTEAFVGKSAVCAGLLDHAQRAGLRTAYMKPVSVSVAHVPGSTLDEDAAFIREALELDAPLSQMAPVLLTPSAVERVLRGEQHDWIGEQLHHASPPATRRPSDRGRRAARENGNRSTDSEIRADT